MQVLVQVEVGIRPPVGRDRTRNRPAAEARKRKEAFLERAAEACEVHRPVEYDHPDDHHQVGRAIHPQPGGVHGRHAFGSGAHWNQSEAQSGPGGESTPIAVPRTALAVATAALNARQAELVATLPVGDRIHLWSLERPAFPPNANSRRMAYV